MGRECCIGFAELFERAKGRGWTQAEAREFAALDQGSRNAMVRELAREAGDIRTEDRLGTDGLIYTAFWVEDPPAFNAG